MDGGQVMSVIIEISPQEIAALKQATHCDQDAEAILQAARQFLRQTLLRELKGASGKVDFDANWQAWGNLELSQSAIPQ
jgi:hypothetical protein